MTMIKASSVPMWTLVFSTMARIVLYTVGW